MEDIIRKDDQADSLYVFNDKLFAEYVDFNKIKDEVISLGIPVDETIRLSEIYKYVVKNCPSEKQHLDKVFFENIMYSQLKNIYINTFSEKVDIDVFKGRMKTILDKIKRNSDIPFPYQQMATEDGFYLMDLIQVTSTGTKFISGFNIEEKNGQLKSAKILFVEAVKDKNNLSRYFIAGIDINFEENFILTMIRNIGDIKEKDLDDEEDYGYNLARTIPSLYKYVKSEIIDVLIKKIDVIDKEKDRKSLYSLCKSLDDELLKDIRKVVQEKTSNTIKRSVNELMNNLYDLEDRPKQSDKEEITANIESLMIANYIKTKHGSNNAALSKMAKTKRLPGYTTKIKFMGNRANRGATQSAGSKQPVSATDMFHSLYISFKQALGLEVWGMSWFEDYAHTDLKKTKVLQTSIYSQSTQFKIIFLPRRPLNKEIIHYVVRYINRQRQQEIDNK
ncbi:hypothetical protein COE55_20950 [Priestia megaterium]|uniref:hypothetical protein n=1 Tax=Priestia megaterium TaxID=1404 RepID=UPI000BFDE15D|nr:hypothetical protein [Priestia megaterium]PGZ72787.1 hypothetical protein COE55_20950 [Priestia megaterium]